MSKKDQLATLRQEAEPEHCPQMKTRTQAVPGEGNPNAEVMIVGQGPGKQEDKEGRPFVGPAGALLDRALQQVGLKREDLWITNIVKCRVTKQEGARVADRVPTAAEKRACRPWLDKELETIRPRILVCLGAPSAQWLIDKNFKISEERGQWRQLSDGTRAIATFHPAYVLHLRSVNESAYKQAWLHLLQDLQKVAEAVKSG